MTAVEVWQAPSVVTSKIFTDTIRKHQKLVFKLVTSVLGEESSTTAGSLRVPETY